MSVRVKRDAFLYLEPVAPGMDLYFAQCGRCRWWKPGLPGRCAILGPALLVNGSDSCGLFVPGAAGAERVEASVTPLAAGFVRRPVRCENCRFATQGATVCGLFDRLNRTLPDTFDLDTRITPQGCCNSNTPK